MLLSDCGAEGIKVEPPGGDPFRATSAYTVWNRGKKSVVRPLRLIVAVDVQSGLAISVPSPFCG